MFLPFIDAAASSGPVTGAPPLVDVKEVCRLVDWQTGLLVFAGTVSEVRGSAAVETQYCPIASKPRTYCSYIRTYRATRRGRPTYICSPREMLR